MPKKAFIVRRLCDKAYLVLDNDTGAMVAKYAARAPAVEHADRLNREYMERVKQLVAGTLRADPYTRD